MGAVTMSRPVPPFTVLPEALEQAMLAALTSAHCDKNAGVPIGARAMAFRVLEQFANGRDVADRLQLWQVHHCPSEWAEAFCTNPDRNSRRRR